MVAGLGGTPRSAGVTRFRHVSRRGACWALVRIVCIGAGISRAIRVSLRRPPRSRATQWDAGPIALLHWLPCSRTCVRRWGSWRAASPSCIACATLGRACGGRPGPRRAGGAVASWECAGTCGSVAAVCAGAFAAARCLVPSGAATAWRSSCGTGHQAGEGWTPRCAAPYASSPGASSRGDGRSGPWRGARAPARRACPVAGARAAAGCANTLSLRPGSRGPRQQPAVQGASCVTVLTCGGMCCATSWGAGRVQATIASATATLMRCGVPTEAPTNRLRPVISHKRQTSRMPHAPIATNTTWRASPRRCRQARPGPRSKNATTWGQASSRSCHASQACRVGRATAHLLAACRWDSPGKPPSPRPQQSSARRMRSQRWCRATLLRCS